MSCVQWPCRILRPQLFVFARTSELDFVGGRAKLGGGVARHVIAGSLPNRVRAKPRLVPVGWATANRPASDCRL